MPDYRFYVLVRKADEHRSAGFWGMAKGGQLIEPHDKGWLVRFEKESDVVRFLNFVKNN